MTIEMVGSVHLTPGRSVLPSASGEFTETFDQAAVMMNLIGDNRLAMLEVGNRHIVSRALMQGVGYFFFENDIPPFQVANCCLGHETSPISQSRQRGAQGSMGCLNVP